MLNTRNQIFKILRYYSAPKQKKELKSLDEVDPEIIKTMENLVFHLMNNNV